MKSSPSSRKEVVGWCLFDVANSSYTTIIITVAFNVVFTKLITGPDPDGTFSHGNALWAWVLAASWGAVALAGPWLGALSDARGWRKRLLTTSVLVCCVSCTALGMLSPGQVALALALVFLSNVGFSLSENFISAFLPMIASPEQMGRLSGLAWGLGYFGGLGSILLCQFFTGLDYSPENYDRLRLLGPVTAAFFLVASLPALLWLKEPPVQRSSRGAPSFSDTWNRLRALPDLSRLLLSCFFFQGSLAIVISFAAIYGEQVVGLTGSDQAILFISLQLTAAGGAFAFGWLQSRWGGMPTLNLTLWVWVLVVFLIYGLETWTRWLGITNVRMAFLVAGNLAGLCLGATQACARALVGQMSPADRAGEMFGLWGLSSKASMVFALFVFGFLQKTVGLRHSLIFCVVLFLVSLGVHVFIDEKRGRRVSECFVG
ncbi:MFS transporter [bacterium]|nr:MFS transporter [bacterium]